nr:hypothetical protein [Gordonia humi]
MVAAVLSWFIAPVITAVLVGAAVVMSVWQVYRRRAGVPPLEQPTWVTITVPCTFGALAVIALNGWIYRISADAGGDDTNAGTLIGLGAGVVGMAAAYGYGRIRAQKAQLDEVVDVDLDDDEPGESDEEWFFPQAK